MIQFLPLHLLSPDQAKHHGEGQYYRQAVHVLQGEVQPQTGVLGGLGAVDQLEQERLVLRR